MTPEKLFESLKKIQEPKGYYFNRDQDMVMELMKSLLKNKERFGYMVCPCRLASGNQKDDRDIFCPCDYRPEDVREFGSCYCGLYVSKDWNEGKIPHEYVPERRPPEKMKF
jgi:ferredoxin-thioredoxin reductase catalytic chain